MNRICINKLNKQELSDCLDQLGQPSTGSVDDLRATLGAYMNKVDISPDHIELLKSFSALYLEIPKTISRSTSPVPDTDNSTLKLLPTTPDNTSHASICDTVRKWGIKYDWGREPLLFLKRIELATCYGISDEILLNTMPELLGNDSLSWYRNNKNNWNSYEDCGWI